MDSLAKFDADLASILTAIDATAPLPAALAIITKHALRDAVLLADRFLSLPEVTDVHELARRGELLDRRQEAAVLLHRNTSVLTAEELARSAAHGRLVIDRDVIHYASSAKLLREHPDLASPERRFTCLVTAFEASQTSAHPYMASTLVTWLALRLTEDPYVEGAAKLMALYREGKVSADVVGATGDRALLAELAPESIACAFELDPAKAFDQFGEALVDTRPFPKGLLPLLHVLAQDGFTTHGVTGRRSTRPRGWVRADPRWIAPLMMLRESDDPNLSIPARDALGNADLERVLDLLPKPKKKIPALKIEALGTLAPAERFWLGADRIVVAGESFTAHSLENGLPLATKFDIAPDVQQVAIRADGGVAAFAPLTTLIACDASGTRIATRDLAGESHGLVFGAGGTGSLWVAGVDDTGHFAAAFDPNDLAPRHRVPLARDYPEPADFTSHTHPKEDVGVFEVCCDQDGSWLVIADGAALRKHKLSGKQPSIGFVGVSGGKAAFAQGRTLTLRAWPGLDGPKKKRLDGSIVGAGVIDGAIALAVAEVSNEPSAIELRRFDDGERIGKVRYPLGERFLAFGAGVLVTTGLDGRLHVHRIRV